MLIVYHSSALETFSLPLLVLPGPYYPTNLDSLLSPIVSELYDLATDGMIVKIDDQELHVKVHLYNVTGDIQGKLVNVFFFQLV